MKQSLRILLLEDLEYDQGEIISALDCPALNLNLFRSNELNGCLAALGNFSPDLVLASFSGPESAGCQVFSFLKDLPDPAVFIGITSIEFEQESIKLLEDGAADCLFRDRLTRLPFAIRRAMETKRLQKQEKNALNSILKKGQRIGQLLQNVPSAVALLTGPDHVIQFANSFYQQLTGKEEIVNKPLREVYTAPEHQFIIQIADQAYKNGETFIDKEVFIELEQGLNGDPQLTSLYINFTMQPLLDVHGIVESLLIFGIDVTEQVLARKETERVYQEIDKLFDAVNEGFFLRDIRKDKYIQLSAGCPKIYGYTIAEFEENSNLWYEVILEEDRHIAHRDSELLLKGEQVKSQYRILHKDKGLRWIEVKAVPTFVDGELITVDGVVSDITSLKIVDETLKKSEANLQTLLDHTDAAYILTDHQLKIVSYSRKASEIAEFRGFPKPFEGTHVFNYFVEQKKSKLEKIVEEVRSGKTVSYEIKVNEKNGVEKWYAMKWIGINDAAQNNWGFILSIRDITRRKKLADQQNQITSELIRRNKDLEQFTYVVSHNLRAPVANIIGLSELMHSMGLDKSGSPELLEGLRTSVRNLDTVIKDLNYILQSKKDAPESIKEPVDLRILVEEIKQSISHLVEKEQMTFEYDMEVSEAYTVRGYIHSIFYNLILNSLKYRSPNHPPCLMIKTYQTGKLLNLIFKDNGKGIDMNKYGNQLFGLYKRFDTDVEGKGMGLFMVKTQIEDLGGSIQVQSEPEKGTTFHIVLPINIPG